MAVRNRITWVGDATFSDPRLANLRELVRGMQNGQTAAGVRGGRYFQNDMRVLPTKPYGYYREFDVTLPGNNGRDSLRIVLGNSGEIYITGNHYTDFRQIIDML